MTIDRNIYKPFRAKLTDVIEESPLIKTFVLVPEEEFSFNTGQFIELSVDGIGEAPFTPSSSPVVTEKLEVTVMKTGYVTEFMHNLKPGVFMGIRGPYGRGYPVEKFFGKEVLILGGGCGLAPIRSLLYALEHVKDKKGRTPVDMAMGVGGRGRAGGPPPVYERTAALIKKLAAEQQQSIPAMLPPKAVDGKQ